MAGIFATFLAKGNQIFAKVEHPSLVVELKSISAEDQTLIERNGGEAQGLVFTRSVPTPEGRIEKQYVNLNMLPKDVRDRMMKAPGAHVLQMEQQTITKADQKLETYHPAGRKPLLTFKELSSFQKSLLGGGDLKWAESRWTQDFTYRQRAAFIVISQCLDYTPKGREKNPHFREIRDTLKAKGVSPAEQESYFRDLAKVSQLFAHQVVSFIHATGSRFELKGKLESDEVARAMSEFMPDGAYEKFKDAKPGPELDAALKALRGQYVDNGFKYEAPYSGFHGANSPPIAGARTPIVSSFPTQTGFELADWFVDMDRNQPLLRTIPNGTPSGEPIESERDQKVRFWTGHMTEVVLNKPLAMMPVLKILFDRIYMRPERVASKLEIPLYSEAQPPAPTRSWMDVFSPRGNR